LLQREAAQEFLHFGGDRRVLCQTPVGDGSDQRMPAKPVGVSVTGAQVNCQQNNDKFFHLVFSWGTTARPSVEEVSLLV
jgi:hypothetical protein